MTDVVDILLRLRGSRQFQSEADKSARSIGGIGKSAEKSGEQAKLGWKGVAKWAAPAAAFAGTAAFMKSAVSATGDLAKSTMALQRSTGLSAETASAWGSVIKARGVDTKAFQMGLTKLSREMVKGGSDSKAYAKTFAQLGVAQDTLQAGDINSVLMQSADAFSKMTNPAQKAALAQQLFGRQAQTLLPIMSSGSEGIREQLALADKYGATLSGDAVGGAKDMIAQQREMKIAMEGVKVQLGTALLPTLLSVVGAFTSLVRIGQPILRNATAMKVLLGALVVTFVAYKAALITTTLSQAGFTTAMITTRVATIASTAAMMGLNASMLLIPLAIAAIVVGLVLLYKKCAWFRNAVNAVWAGIKAGAEAVFHFVRDNWKLLLAGLAGPMGLAVAMVIKHWDEIKAAVGAAVDWMLDKIRPLTDAVGKVAGFASKVGGGALHALPGLATGGTIQRAGAAVVGERGPEVVTLPRGAGVIPIPQVQSVGAAPSLDPGGAQTIVTKVFLDRRQIAEAVGSYVADKRARR